MEFRRRYLEQELLEVSAVGIPANPNALQLGLKAGAVARADLRELLERLRDLFGSERPEEFSAPPARRILFQSPPGALGTDAPYLISCSNPAVTDTHACASGVPNYEAQLLQLARAVRDALKR